VVYVYDVTNKDSLQQLEAKWMEVGALVWAKGGGWGCGGVVASPRLQRAAAVLFSINAPVDRFDHFVEHH